MKFRVVDRNLQPVHDPSGRCDYADVVDAVKACRRDPNGYVVVSIASGKPVTQPNR